MRSFGNFLMGLLSGALVGTLIGLLLAPDKGVETQNRIQHYLINLRDEVDQAAQQKRSALEEELAKLRQPKSE